MRVARLGHLPAVLALCGALALGGCGKGAAERPAAHGGPTKAVAAVAAGGAVSVVTRNTTRLGGADVATDATAVARAVYPGLTSATRPQAVVLVDERDWPAALAASELASAPLNAPIIYSEGDVLPAVSLEALEALDPQGASALGGVQVLRIGTSAPVPARFVTHSLPAAAAQELAGSVEQLLASSAGAASHDVIVVPTNVPLALQMPAAGLAAESGSPILFVAPGNLAAATTKTLVGLHHPSIYLLDSARVAVSTLHALRHLGTVSEIPSSAPGEAVSPSASAIAAARFTDGQFGWGVKEPGHGLVFASAFRPLDAPAAALLSATADYGPLLLLEGPRQISAGLASSLGDIQPAYADSYVYRPAVGVYNHGWLIGDEKAISEVVQGELDSLLEISPSKQTPAEPSTTQGE